ncbi:MAG: restriction endonuclease subunit S [Candidatus Paceibacterota bacterium]
MKIQEFANVISGYTFRGTIENQSGGDVFVIQAKNIASGVDIKDSQNLVKILFNGAHGASFLQNNDITIVSRGYGRNAFRATVFKSDINNIVASSSIIIIRITDNRVLPEFISSFINSSEGQKRIMESVTGSSIKAILRGKFREISIPLPPIEKQETIIKLTNNLKQQEEINARKMQIKKNIANSIFEKI